MKHVILTALISLINLSCHANERDLWVDYLTRISYPILKSVANDSLRLLMPVYSENTRDFQYLEAFGRTLCGIAPWLELGADTTNEGRLRKKYIELTLLAISNAVNPNAVDYMNFSRGNQPLVDAAYLSQGLLRAPTQIWESLDKNTQQRVVTELKKTRSIKPGQTNWLLFASMIEACLLEYDGECDEGRLRDGVEKFLFKFYKGDGIYGDGASLAMDFYNSYVIHPMLLMVITVANKHGLSDFDYYENLEIPRLQRYAVLQERMISPDGTYPVWGRTLICRTGVFHALAETVYRDLLPPILYEGGVKAAMTAVLERQMGNEDNFDDKGFMTVGFAGKQDSIAETYVSSGSAYHCTTFFLPLGLKPEARFWSEPSKDWTTVRAFNGEEITIDHSYAESGRKAKLYRLWKNLCISLNENLKLTLSLIVGIILMILGILKLSDIIRVCLKHNA